MTMTTMQKTERRPQTNLTVLYKPVGIRAVIAAAMQIKARQLPGR